MAVLGCMVLSFSATVGAQTGRPTLAGAVPLEEALARAAGRGSLVHAAHERRQAALGARAAVPALPNPFVELRGENVGSHPKTLLTHDVFATISQTIELGGKRAARAAAADAAVAIAEAEVQSAEWAVALEVASLYVEALRARELLATLTNQQASLADLVTTLAQRVQEGFSAEADLRRFQTEHQRLVRQVSRTEIVARGAVLRLSAIVGQPIELQQLVPLSTTASPLPLSVDPALLTRRPDIAAAQARLTRAEAALRVERARAIPDVIATTGYKRTAGIDTAVAGITMPISLFDRNRAAAAVAAGEVAAARSEFGRIQYLALADAQAQVEAASRLASQAASARQDLLEPATVVRVAARASYAEGRGDVLQLVDAERVFAEASREVIELQLDAALARINARLSLGDPPLP